jgi:hypothetical protein
MNIAKHLKTAPALTGDLPGLKNVSGLYIYIYIYISKLIVDETNLKYKERC